MVDVVDVVDVRECPPAIDGSKVFRSMLAALPTCLEGVISCQDFNGWIPDECLVALERCTRDAAQFESSGMQWAHCVGE